VCGDYLTADADTEWDEGVGRYVSHYTDVYCENESWCTGHECHEATHGRCDFCNEFVCKEHAHPMLHGCADIPRDMADAVYLYRAWGNA
jgi:hypothetical protein